MQRAAELAKTQDLPPDQRSALRDVIREARAELRNKTNDSRPDRSRRRRSSRCSLNCPSRRSRLPPRSRRSPDDVTAFLSRQASVRTVGRGAAPADAAGDRACGTEGLSAEQRQALRDVIREARAALRNTGGDNQQTGQQTPSGYPAAAGRTSRRSPGRAGRSRTGTPRRWPSSTTRWTSATMDRRDLRQRLCGIRDLLASDQLSPQTQRGAAPEACRGTPGAAQRGERERRQRPHAAGHAAQGSRRGKPQDRPRTRQGQAAVDENNNVTINNTTTNTHGDQHRDPRGAAGPASARCAG